MQFEAGSRIKLSQVYDLPNQEVLNEYCFSLNHKRFPELNLDFSWQQAEAIHADGRLVQKRLEYVYVNGDDEDDELQTMWFDGRPFAILQSLGRECTRWVTDYAVLFEALSYLVKRAQELSDVDEVSGYLAPDTELPVETVFAGRLEQKFVIQEVLPPADDRFMLGHCYHTLEAGQTLVMAKTSVPPVLLRRGKVFLQYDRVLTESEQDVNGKLLMPDSPYVRQGFGHMFLYRRIGRPENFSEAVVF